MANFVDIGSFSKTVVVAASATHAEFTSPGPYTEFVVHSERAIHLSRNGNATTDDFRLDTGDYARITLLKGEILSIVIADGETDGDVWVTEVS